MSDEKKGIDLDKIARQIRAMALSGHFPGLQYDAESDRNPTDVAAEVDFIKKEARGNSRDGRRHRRPL